MVKLAISIEKQGLIDCQKELKKWRIQIGPALRTLTKTFKCLDVNGFCNSLPDDLLIDRNLGETFCPNGT